MKSIINRDELNNQLEKIAMYKSNESIIFDSIKEILNHYDYLCETNNQEKINDIKIELFNKLNTIKNIHENYIKIIYQNITKYEETSKKTEIILSNIERY